MSNTPFLCPTLIFAPGHGKWVLRAIFSTVAVVFLVFHVTQGTKFTLHKETFSVKTLHKELGYIHKELGRRDAKTLHKELGYIRN